MKYAVLLIITTGLALSHVSRAGGYQPGLYGQKQTGMGLAGTSLAFDAGCMFFNPGGLSFIANKYSFSAGMNAVISKVAFQKENQYNYQSTTEDPAGLPFYFYGSALTGAKWNVGIALNTPFTGHTSWEEDWDGRFVNQEYSLQTLFIQPTASFRINDQIGIGAGLVFATGRIVMEKAIPVSGQESEGQVHINGSGTGWGFNAGILIRPLDDLSIGVTYRSKVELDVKHAEAAFSVPESLEPSFPADNEVSTSIPLPASLNLGGSYRFSEKFMLAMDLSYVFWNVYKSLDLDFKSNTEVLEDSENERDFTNQLVYKVGGRYASVSGLTFSLGMYYDPSPVNDDYFSPENPSLDNLGLTAGICFDLTEKISAEASFIYSIGLKKEVEYVPDDFNGSYKSSFYIPGLGITMDL